MTELSLDILLFVIGKLDIAGPFAVKSSLIFGNCCKVMIYLNDLFKQRKLTFSHDKFLKSFVSFGSCLYI